MNNLENPRVWLITGCSSGLGHALASAVLARGQRVIATARNPAALSELAAQYPETCRAVALDVTVPSQVQSVLAEANQAFGRIDVVVNNAGYGVVGAFEELSPEQVERNFNTNFFGALEATAKRTRPCWAVPLTAAAPSETSFEATVGSASTAKVAFDAWTKDPTVSVPIEPPGATVPLLVTAPRMMPWP